MISRVLVAMDGSKITERGLEFAIEAYPDAEITVLTVIGEPSGMMGEAVGLVFEESRAEGTEDAEVILDRAQEIAAEDGRELEGIIGYGNPASEIVTRAGEFDTVVIGHHDSSIADRLFIGNTAHSVVRNCPVPVTVVR
ncbi:universal stress protein [Halovenus sp. WSH3]|uniref:Universal stress protein n=1 Tax=Halovenus carboxidivorans TaxID=2692199 RepID=A0A6B0T4N0_9EURY|nr:universal stress protein [Halovenus carboxidivorans]MXR53014.1 universal stress protein [Halovenus carboxidivorans]